MVDWTKPLRFANKFAGKEVKTITVVATDVMAELPLSDMPSRYEDQTILVRLDYLDPAQYPPSYRYYWPNGNFMLESDNDSDRLENIPPEPVVVKTRRQVYIEKENKVHRTSPVNKLEDTKGRPIIEFTVTDGVLTNVEIVK